MLVLRRIKCTLIAIPKGCESSISCGEVHTSLETLVYHHRNCRFKTHADYEVVYRLVS